MISAKKSAKTFLWTFLGALLGFFNQLLIARILGPVEYGKANIVIGASGIATLVLSFGLSPFLIREVSKIEDERTAQSYFSFFLFFSILIDGISVIPASIILSHYFEKVSLPKYDIIFAILLIFLSHTISLTYGYYVGRKKQNTAMFYRDFVPRLLKSIAFLVIFIAGWKIYHNIFLFISIIASFSMFILTIKNVRKPIIVRGFIKDSMQFYIIALLYSTFSNLSKILQSFYSKPQYVGYLSLGLTLGNVGVMIGSVLASMAMPEFSYHWSKGNYEEIKNIFQQASRWSTYSTLPIAIYVAIHIDYILEILGKDYKEGYTIILIILASQFFNAFVGPNGTLLNMSGYQRYEILNGAVMLTVSILIGTLIGPKYSWGIALAVACGIITVNLMKLIEVAKIHKIWPYDRKTLIYIAGIGLGTFIAMKTIKNMIANPFLSLMLNLILLLIVISIFFLFSPSIEDRKVVKKIIDRFSKH